MLRCGTCFSLFVCLCLTGCNRYANFSLPVPAPGPKVSSFAWKPDPSPSLSPGDWDSVDVLNPSVVLRDNTYYNFYSGFDGNTWHTGLAISNDGFHWRKQGRIISPQPETWEGDYWATNGSALLNGSDFLYWYQAGLRAAPKIGLARSMDGVTWEKLPGSFAGSERWNNKVICDPSVLVEGDSIRVWFGGGDVASPDENLHGQIGVANLIPKL